MTGFHQTGEEEFWHGWLLRGVRASFTAPDGEAFEREIVRHPGAVAIVAVDDQRRVTLVRQFRPAIGHELLEIPAGTRDQPGEEPERTARRELVEEAGLEAAHLVELARTYNSPGFCDQESILYLATGLTPCADDRAGVEERFLAVEQIDLDDLESLADGGTPVDQSTLLALLLARRRLGPPG